MVTTGSNGDSDAPIQKEPTTDVEFIFREYIFMIPLCLMPFLVTFVDFCLLSNIYFVVDSEEGFNNYPEALTSWVFSSLFISTAIATPISGRLGDIYSKKKVLLVILFFYFISITLCGFSPNLVFMIACRTLQGVGAGSSSLLMGILRDTFPPKKVSPLIMVATGANPLGISTGFLLGGWISTKWGWRMSFYVGSPVAFIMLVLVYLLVNDMRMAPPPQPLRIGWVYDHHPDRAAIRERVRLIDIEQKNDPNHENIDWRGAFFFALTITVVCIASSLTEIWGISFASEGDGWKTIGMGYVGIMLGVFWWLYNCSIGNPFIPPRLIRHPQLFAVYIGSIITGINMLITHTCMPLYLATPTVPPYYGHGLQSSQEVGWRLAMLGPSELMSIFILAAYSNRFRGEVIMVGAMSVMALFLVILSYWHRSNFSIFTMQLMLGFPQAAGLSSLTLATTQLAPQELFSTALSITKLGASIGKSIGPILASTVLNNYRSDYQGESYPSELGFQVVWRLSAGLCLLNGCWILYNVLKKGTQREAGLKIIK
eukprot:gnl/Dysnectes_brevis/2332_a2748_1064.p1 GENE.gnl/Dysnectes_brevis/2332_a2748_1064~~gnl/Dysnectes_brevis/2332_a2748_1064.p1  ORF type:complete len:541 (+),score=94.66 gnl/Dysnectes_brevis/2332_a2748_1064:36-1658(+)